MARAKGKNKKRVAFKIRIERIRVAIGLSWRAFVILILVAGSIAYLGVYHSNFLTSTLLLEYFKAGVWPAIVLIAIVVIRPFLPALIEERDIEFSNGKSALKLIRQQKAASIDEPAEDEKANKQTTKVATTNASPPTTKQPANLIQETIDKIKRESDFKKINETIFGTQLSVLIRLDTYGELKPSELEDLVTRHVTLANGKGFTTLLEYMQYLVSSELVGRNVSTGSFSITERGREYLTWNRQNKTLPFKRPF